MVKGLAGSETPPVASMGHQPLSLLSEKLDKDSGTGQSESVGTADEL